MHTVHLPTRGVVVMAIASNPLLQTGPSAAPSSTSKTTALNALSNVADSTKDGGSSFAEAYAQAHKSVPVAPKPGVGSATRVSQHLVANDKKPTAAFSQKDDKPAVATDNKSSPVNKPDRSDKAGKAAQADKQAKADTDDQTVDVVDDDQAEPVKAADDIKAEATVADSTVESLPVLDPTATPPAPVPPAADPAQVPPLAMDPAQLQSAAVPVTPPMDTFDPHADALADLPMVRMALEQNAKAQGTTSVHAQTDAPAASASNDPATADTFAQTMSGLLDQKAVDGTKVSEDSDGLGAIGDVKGAAGDGSGSRVTDLNGRLDSLTQAVTGKTASAVATPPATPLNMHQSGWSEGVVNRVMYLSSQNLKSADIQLHPLELGRLDIRIDVTADQTTQVTFHSAHLGVRDALESQQGRLRDMLTQQGLTQVDVNVSDQSRQQQQQQQQQAQTQAQANQGAGNRASQGERAADDSQVSPAAEAAATQHVIGSSLVDYYA